MNKNNKLLIVYFVNIFKEKPKNYKKIKDILIMTSTLKENHISKDNSSK